MYCLFIDSGIEPGVTMLLKDDAVRGVLFSNSREPSFPFQGIDALLEKEHLHKTDIDAIAVGVGPGSYTGIRTSVAVCQMFSFAKQVPLLSVSSLFRWIPKEDGLFRIAHDARMGGVFSLLARVEQGVLDGSFSLEKLPIEKLLEISAREQSTLVVDEKVSARLSHLFGSSETLLLAKESGADHLARYIFQNWSAKKYLIGETPEVYYTQTGSRI